MIKAMPNWMDKESKEFKLLLAIYSICLLNSLAKLFEIIISWIAPRLQIYKPANEFAIYCVVIVICLATWPIFGVHMK